MLIHQYVNSTNAWVKVQIDSYQTQISKNCCYKRFVHFTKIRIMYGKENYEYYSIENFRIIFFSVAVLTVLYLQAFFSPEIRQRFLFH